MLKSPLLPAQPPVQHQTELAKRGIILQTLGLLHPPLCPFPKPIHPPPKVHFPSSLSQSLFISLVYLRGHLSCFWTLCAESVSACAPPYKNPPGSPQNKAGLKTLPLPLCSVSSAPWERSRYVHIKPRQGHQLQDLILSFHMSKGFFTSCHKPELSLLHVVGQ